MADRISAVIVGDIINSTSLSAAELDEAMTAIASCAASMSAEFARFRGDGWQAHHPFREAALTLALRILAELRRTATQASTRMAIGFGTANIIDRKLATGSGSAFEVSGRLLDKMPARQSFAVGGEGASPLHEAVLMLCGQIASGWTRTQAEAVSEALSMTLGPDLGPNQADIAARLGITRQATQARLAGAGFGTIQSALSAWGATT